MGVKYSVDYVKIEEKGTKSKHLLTHTLTGNCCINTLLQAKKAKFGCSLIFKNSIDRKFHLCQSIKHMPESAEEIVQEQQIEITLPSPHHHDFIIYPVVVCPEEVSLAESPASGLNSLWEDKQLIFPGGAILAKGLEIKVLWESTVIQWASSDKLPIGEICVDQTKDMTFTARMHPELIQQIQIGRRTDLGKAIIANCLTALFGKLQKNYWESSDADKEEWKKYPPLLAISQQLEKQKIPHWGDDRFEPISAGTALMSVLPTITLPSDEEDE